MVLQQLKQIRDELRKSAEVYDNAFQTTAIIAAQELVSATAANASDNSDLASPKLQPSLDRRYFLAKYGSLNNAKAAYRQKYGELKYGRSWSDFIIQANKLADSDPEIKQPSLEDRITKIENFLVTLGYQA